MQTKTLKRSLIGAAIVGAFAVGYAGYSQQWIGQAHALAAEKTPAVAAPVQAAASAPAVVGASLPDFRSIVERAGPAVVNISVTATAKTSFNQMSPFPGIDPDDPFFEFFKRFQMPTPRGEAPARSTGSGFIVSPDGVVLTNAHVVANASEVNVKLTDKREFKAKVVGLDKLTDVAVLRIDAKNLPTVRLGDPTRTQVGEWVLAIGSPFGFENSVTAGIVSAKSRSLPDDGYVPFIQTDVAVNPGNSGGPLINLNGEVVGINSQIYSRSGGYQGVSFAIPIDVAMRVEGQLVKHGKVSHGRLGVSIQEVNQSLAESFGLKGNEGALVASVEKGSPAAKAGLEPGDVILSFNGKDIGRSTDLPPLVAEVSPGSNAKLKVWRNGQAREYTVTVGELASAKVASNEGGGGAETGRLGLAVRPLSPEESRQAETSGGLVVEDASGPAARAGIQPGDIILALNGQPVKDAETLRSLVAKAGKHAALLIQRDDAKIFVPLNLG